MSVTASQIKSLPSGEFTSDSDDTINTYIQMAEARVDSGILDTLYDTVVLYMTAHLLSSDKSGAFGPAGPVSSESAGQISRSYGVQQGEKGTLNSTAYGRRVLEILSEQVSVKGFVV